MTKYLTVAILLAIIGYGSIEAWPLIAGPSLSILSPENNAPFSDGIVTIKGNAARAAALSINGASVSHEGNGDFSSTLTFPHGSSILTFVATDRFGRKVATTRTIFVPF
ncbi:MAG: hypothetical protein WC887_00705 [Candidatus Paceibacterota bacterium]|jgi:hypothetical protein